MSNTKTFFAEFQSLNEMLHFVKNYCLTRGFNSSEIYKINVATEEALVNIICHAYPHDSKETIEISCEDCQDKPGVKILIKDQGTPFNPIENKDKIKEKHRQYLQENVIGGWGIFLYIKIMDGVEYNRDGKTNTLCFIKYKDERSER